MIDDSVTNMVAIFLTALFLGILNSFQYAEKQLPPGSLPQIQLTPNSTTGESGGPIIKPGTIITGALAPLANWASKLGHEHPLVGRIWATDRQEGVLPTEVVNAAAEADVVILGETHDNPDHHKLQAYLIRELARKGKHPGVVMEMIGADKAETLASYQVASNNPSADGLGSKVDWEASGWPAWSMYKPVVESTLAAGAAVFAGDAARDMIGQVSKGGLGTLSYSERVRLGLAAALPEPLATALAADIRAVHCNQMPDANIGPMTQVQRYRDAVLADNVLKAADKSGGSAILITGGGHARTDRGVPYYLHNRASGLKIVSIQFSEVETGVENPEDAVPRDPAGKPAADFVWFTARTERPDPCVELQKQLQGGGKTTAG
jgi:uncharacterized iron-regulated protein